MTYHLQTTSWVTFFASRWWSNSRYAARSVLRSETACWFVEIRRFFYVLSCYWRCHVTCDTWNRQSEQNDFLENLLSHFYRYGQMYSNHILGLIQGLQALSQLILAVKRYKPVPAKIIWHIARSPLNVENGWIVGHSPLFYFVRLLQSSPLPLINWTFALNQSIKQSMYFKERFKLYNLQIYIAKHILFLHDIHLILVIMKTNLN